MPQIARNKMMFSAIRECMTQKFLVLIALLCGYSAQVLGESSESITSTAPQVSTTKQEGILLWRSKAAARHNYEKEVLEAALKVTAKTSAEYKVNLDRNEEFPGAEEKLFSHLGFDVMVTPTNNPKMEKEEKIIVNAPLMNGLLGYRLAIVRTEDLGKFRDVKTEEQLKSMEHGIPKTWVDANLYRHNGYTVVENGDFGDIFHRLKNNEFDYIALGANEIEKVFKQRVENLGGLSIEPNLLIHYPFTLSFYVNPKKPELALRIEQGMAKIKNNGELDKIYKAHFGELVQRLNLKERRRFSLVNPLLPTGTQVAIDGDF